MPQLLNMWPYCVMAVVLIVAAITDFRTGKVFNWITYPAIGVGLVGHTLLGGFGGSEWSGEWSMGLLGSLAGLAVGFLPLLLAWLAGGIGGGDAKLMGSVGALAGWQFAVSAMFYGFAVAALMAIAVMIRERAVKRTMGRVWRFVAVAFMRGKPADPAGPGSRKIPFGTALCVGSAVAMIKLAITGELLIEGG